MARPPQMTWADLFITGSLIDLDVAVWDCLTKIHPSDLGIPKTEAVKKGLTFGHERLIAKDKLDPLRKLEGEARRIIEKHTLPFKLIPGSRFTPRTNRKPMLEKLDDIRERFYAAVKEFMAGYEQNKRDQMEVLRQALAEASGSHSVADAAMDRIGWRYPGKETVRARFSIGWTMHSIAPPIDGQDVDAQKQGNAVRDSIVQMIDNVRQRLSEKVASIVELASTGGKITARTYNSATALCDRLEAMNIFHDSGLTNALARVRNAINQAADADNSATVLADGLGGVEKELTASREQAILDAMNSLTGKGARRMDL